MNKSINANINNGFVSVIVNDFAELVFICLNNPAYLTCIVNWMMIVYADLGF